MSAIPPRWSHASTLITTTSGSTLYITGGTTHDPTGKTSILADTLALDLTKEWSIDNPLLNHLEPMKAPLSGHSMNRIPGSSTQLLVAGGESSIPNPPPILLFDRTGSEIGSWSVPPLSKDATATFHRLHHASLTTGKDGALLQGGYLTTPSNGTVVSSLVTLKAINHFAPLATAPVSMATQGPALARHTMTLTPDGHAVILGGINSAGVVANMSVAYVLDTQANSGSWKAMPLVGNAPDPRMAFSTVMVNSTTLLVYGGTKDFRSALSNVFYLDVPTWTWSSPETHGEAPSRWGHTATISGGSMIVAFGTTTTSTSESNPIALLDLNSNTWVKQHHPLGMIIPDEIEKKSGPLSVGAVLAIAFFTTAFIVGGAFHCLVRRRKRRTRNTMAREDLGDETARTAIRRKGSNQRMGFFSNAANLFGLGGGGHGRQEGGRAGSNSKRYSEMSLYSNPMTISSRLAQMGYSPVSLGYPELVVQQGSGSVSVANYIYPNQACVETVKEQDGQETLIVYHTLTQAQQEALKLSKEPPKSNIQHSNKHNSKLF